MAVEELLQMILNERRKELVGRGIRWSDLKRLKVEGRFDKVLQRHLNGKEYRLLDVSLFRLPIPPSEN